MLVAGIHMCLYASVNERVEKIKLFKIRKRVCASKCQRWVSRVSHVSLCTKHLFYDLCFSFTFFKLELREKIKKTQRE